jgi:hypothetical protein
LTIQQWANSTEDKLWTIEDLEILNQDLTQLDERSQYTHEALKQNCQTAQFLNKEVLTAVLDKYRHHDYYPGRDPPSLIVSNVRDDLHLFDQLVERNSFDALKMEYISQNYIRVAAFLVILFLPGIFISVSAQRSLRRITPD